MSSGSSSGSSCNICSVKRPFDVADGKRHVRQPIRFHHALLSAQWLDDEPQAAHLRISAGLHERIAPVRQKYGADKKHYRFGHAPTLHGYA